MFRMLVVSDLHLHHGDNESGEPSYLSSLPRLESPTRNPLSGIPDLLKSEQIRPDWILCPGDLGDKCDQLAQSEAWKQLEKVRRRTNSRKLIGSVGNHDVDSRRNSAEYRPNDALLSLSPMFPATPKRESDRFWREGFVCIQNDAYDINLTVLNSCEFHGVVSAHGADEESIHGKVSARTIDKLAASLKTKLRGRNILLVHHHVRQHPWLPNESSHLQNGAALLEVLKQTGRQWLVIHGHQHLPNLSYSEGGATAPVVLSAGSIAAPTTVIRSKRPRNQMYCIEFPSGKNANVELFGHIRAWDWYPHLGWQPSHRESGLPHSCGFGFRSIGELAEKVFAQVSTAISGQLRWPQVTASLPEIGNLIPDDIDTLINSMESKGALVDYDRWGMPSAVGVRRISNA